MVKTYMVLYENRLSIKWKWVCISAYLLYILILNLYVFEFNIMLYFTSLWGSFQLLNIIWQTRKIESHLVERFSSYRKHYINLWQFVHILWYFHMEVGECYGPSTSRKSHLLPIEAMKGDIINLQML